MSLTDNQHKMLQTLVDCHVDAGTPVKRKTIAGIVGCHPVTVSVRMQNLRALNLVESTSGPRGGYEPTPNAHETLANRDNVPLGDVPITTGGDPIEGIQIREIALPGVHDPDQCRGELSLNGPITDFALDNSITIGPMPVSNLCIEGIVAEKHPTSALLVLEIEAMYTSAEGQVHRDQR